MNSEPAIGLELRRRADAQRVQLLHVAVLVAGELDAVDAPVANAALFVRALGAQLQGPQRPRGRRCALCRRLGHDLELVYALCALAMAGAQAVCAGIAAADDEYVLALGADRRIGVDEVAFVAAVLLGQELHGEVNAFELAAGNRQIARLLGAAAEQDGVVVFGERFDGHIDADMRVGQERDALGAHLVDAAVDHMFFELEVGNAVAQQAADAVVLLEDGDRVPGAAQLLRGSEA